MSRIFAPGPGRKAADTSSHPPLPNSDRSCSSFSRVVFSMKYFHVVTASPRIIGISDSLPYDASGHRVQEALVSRYFSVANLKPNSSRNLIASR